MAKNPRPPGYGLWLLATGALLALAFSVFDYVWTGNGIHGTEGALVVIVSSALMLGAAIALHIAPLVGEWLRATLLTLILLDIAGTALAAYMLEAYGLLAVMAVALVGWIVRVVHHAAPRAAPATATR